MLRNLVFETEETSRDQVVGNIMTTVSILSQNVIDKKFILILHSADIMTRNIHSLIWSNFIIEKNERNLKPNGEYIRIDEK